ncbi:MAG: hypothetical protein ABJK06_18355 [Parasphingorhabdus sp.]
MENETKRFEMRVSVSFLDRIDTFRRAEPDLPSRAQAIRRLVEKALSSGRQDD